jgi:predicted GNAT superfamily acetyltransferase
MILRELTTIPEFAACMDLQREGFGWNDLDLMPFRFFVVSRHVGGLVLGAFDGDRLVGFLSTIPGIRDGEPYWHSHMLAVTGSHRGAGIGASLKMEQKAAALRRGITRIEWTFDPLVSRNSYFNFEKLGIVVHRYYPDFYGSGSDRLIAEWWLDRPRPARTGDVRRISVLAGSENSPSERLRVRQEFLDSFAAGFFATEFERHQDGGDYILLREAPDANRAT